MMGSSVSSDFVALAAATHQAAAANATKSELTLEPIVAQGVAAGATPCATMGSSVSSDFVALAAAAWWVAAANATKSELTLEPIIAQGVAPAATPATSSSQPARARTPATTNAP